MPGPVSLTRITAQPFSAVTFNDTAVPAGVCTAALVSRLSSTCRNRVGSAAVVTVSASTSSECDGRAARNASAAASAITARSSSSGRNGGSDSAESRRASNNRSSSSTLMRAASDRSFSRCFSRSPGSLAAAYLKRSA